jgi:hypothetical protein
MKKLFLLIIAVTAIISFTVFSINLVDIITTRNWNKAEATVTSVLLPDGIICGDFKDSKGVMHTNQPLYQDFKFQQFRAIKDVKQDKINSIIGKKVVVLYKDEQTVSYDNLWKNIMVSLVLLLLSISILIYMKKHNRN